MHQLGYIFQVDTRTSFQVVCKPKAKFDFKLSCRRPQITILWLKYTVNTSSSYLNTAPKRHVQHLFCKMDDPFNTSLIRIQYTCFLACVETSWTRIKFTITDCFNWFEDVLCSPLRNSTPAAGFGIMVVFKTSCIKYHLKTVPKRLNSRQRKHCLKDVPETFYTSTRYQLLCQFEDLCLMSLIRLENVFLYTSIETPWRLIIYVITNYFNGCEDVL